MIDRFVDTVDHRHRGAVETSPSKNDCAKVFGALSAGNGHTGAADHANTSWTHILSNGVNVV